MGQWLHWLLQDAFNALVLGAIVLGVVAIAAVVRLVGWMAGRLSHKTEEGPPTPER